MAEILPIRRKTLSINQSINFEIVKCKHIEEHVHNVAYFTNNYCLPCVVFLIFLFIKSVIFILIIYLSL